MIHCASREKGGKAKNREPGNLLKHPAQSFRRKHAAGWAEPSGWFNVCVRLLSERKQALLPDPLRSSATGRDGWENAIMGLDNP